MAEHHLRGPVEDHLACAHDDHATAGITLNAQNNILVVGNDPIADAFAGSVGAFLQTHFTRDLIHSGASGGVAGSLVIVPKVRPS